MLFLYSIPPTLYDQNIAAPFCSFYAPSFAPFCLLCFGAGIGFVFAFGCAQIHLKFEMIIIRPSNDLKRLPAEKARMREKMVQRNCFRLRQRNYVGGGAAEDSGLAPNRKTNGRLKRSKNISENVNKS